MYETNDWVEAFYAPHTLEVDFALTDERANKEYIGKVIEQNYVNSNTIDKHKENLNNGTDAKCANTVLTLARDMGKGWYATVLSSYIDVAVTIPQYILKAVAFASREIISVDIVFKMMEYSLSGYDETFEILEIEFQNNNAISRDERVCCINKFREIYPDDMLSKFLQEVDLYCEGWCE